MWAALIPAIAAVVGSVAGAVGSGMQANAIEQAAREQALAYRVMSANSTQNEKVKAIASSTNVVGAVVVAGTLGVVLVAYNR